MGLQKIFKIRDVLKKAGVKNINHYEAVDKPDQYAVWTEMGERTPMNADNAKHEQILYGVINYFTKSEMDEIPDKIQDNLNEGRISFFLASVQYENETGYIHYEWEWEVA